MRVSLAGGGTDLPPFVPGLGGHVVGTAIDLRVVAIAEPFDRGWIRLELSATGLEITRRSDEPRSRETSTRLLEEALACTGTNDGVRLRVETDLVPGTGLGGSAAAAVAALAALAASAGEAAAEPEALALDAMRVERDGLSITCGAQDQFFAACGGMLDLRFDAGALVGREVVAADPALVRKLEAGTLLVDTGQRRVSGDIIDRSHYDPSACFELVEAAEDVARSLREGSLEGVIAGMRRSAAAKIARHADSNAGALELASRLMPLGAEVVRMCGAGGGGHVLVWAPEDRIPAISAALSDAVVRRPPLGAPGARLEEA